MFTFAPRLAKNQRAASVPSSREELIQGDERSCSLRHRDLFAVADEPHPAGEDHLDVVHLEAHRLGRVPDPGHGSVVVSAPDEHESIEAPAELLDDIADVRGEIRRRAIRPDDHPILVVPERRRAEPRGAVGLVHVARVAESLDRPLDPALAVEAALGGPDVKMHAEPFERCLDPGPHLLRRPATDRGGGIRPVREVRPVREIEQFRGDDLRQLRHVVAVVAVLGDRGAVEGGDHRKAQVPHLRPGRR